MNKLGRFLQRQLRKIYAYTLPADAYLKWEYKRRTGKTLHLDAPVTFTEKLQWLKLHDIHPEYTEMVDKVDAKQYVADRIGEQYIVPTIGVWDTIEQVDWAALPEQFVIKVSSDSGGVIVCKDKQKLDMEAAKRKLAHNWGRNYYVFKKEYPYRDVKPRLIAEQYLTNGADADLPDYKFYCFGGEPVYCQVIRDRHSKETIDFYDTEWNHMPFCGLNPKARNGERPVEKPACLDEMLAICRKLSAGIPFVRVDLYLIGEKIYFGELTFFPACGMGIFTPGEWDRILGEKLQLPKE